MFWSSKAKIWTSVGLHSKSYHYKCSWIHQFQQLLPFITKSFIPLKEALKKWENFSFYYWRVLSQKRFLLCYSCHHISPLLVCIVLNYPFVNHYNIILGKNSSTCPTHNYFYNFMWLYHNFFFQIILDITKKLCEYARVCGQIVSADRDSVSEHKSSITFCSIISDYITQISPT